MATKGSKPTSRVAKRRKKYATKAQTAHLQKWLDKNKHNPHPTRAEKEALIIASGMSRKQVNDWFGNARRRMKKKNRSISHNNEQASNHQDSVDNQGSPKLAVASAQPYNHQYETNWTYCEFTIFLPTIYPFCLSSSGISCFGRSAALRRSSNGCQGQLFKWSSMCINHGWLISSHGAVLLNL